MGKVKAPFFLSQRFLLAFLSFLGTLMNFVTRVNLSVAVICMVKNPSPANGSAWNTTSGTGVNQTDDVCGGDSGSTEDADANNVGEFDWDKQTVSDLLAMYFYGYIFTQIPAGWLATRYGGQVIWGASMAVCSICTLLTPVCARTHVYLLYTVRFVLGLAAGLTFPCLSVMQSKWVPPYERSKLTSLAFAGIFAGNIVTFSISGVLCNKGFDNGWGSIFYLSGIFNTLWVIAWFFMTADSPAQHKWISDWERMYIETNIGKSGGKKVTSVPWFKLLTSVPVWALITAHVCSNYANYTLITSLPLFMKESLKFDIEQNGLLSALPYVCQAVASIGAGILADVIIEKGWMSTTKVRRSAQLIAFLGTSAGLAVVGQLTCEQRSLAVVILCVSTICNSFNRAGFMVNHLDLAPSYSGIIYGLTNTGGTIPGMVAPIIAGALTPNKSSEEWKNVFYVCSAVAAFGAVIFTFLSDGELQEWAVTRETIIFEGDKHELIGSAKRRKGKKLSSTDETTLLIESRT
ncbi:hypothetical protein Btru_039833 [Bulinus truncatus]|nr:hypothetical protein Btru_039833 [Bulinus truncatus]